MSILTSEIFREILNAEGAASPVLRMCLDSVKMLDYSIERSEFGGTGRFVSKWSC